MSGELELNSHGYLTRWINWYHAIFINNQSLSLVLPRFVVITAGRGSSCHRVCVLVNLVCRLSLPGARPICSVHYRSCLIRSIWDRRKLKQVEVEHMDADRRTLLSIAGVLIPLGDDSCEGASSLASQEEEKAEQSQMHNAPENNFLHCCRGTAGDDFRWAICVINDETFVAFNAIRVSSFAVRVAVAYSKKAIQSCWNALHNDVRNNKVANFYPPLQFLIA
jgi:hypothetical protein